MSNEPAPYVPGMPDPPQPAATTYSPAATDLIKASESKRLTVYRDPAGIPTGGWGHRILPSDNLSVGDAVSEEKAEEWLAADTDAAWESVNRLVRVALTQGQADGLTDFTFNVGSARLASSTLLERLNAGDYAAVPGQLMLWVNADGKPLPGLVIRRQRECDLWNGKPLNLET